MNKYEVTKFLTQVKEIFVLSRVKLFFFRELRWFIISIILIATLFSLSLSFLTGLGSQEIFISDSDDVLIISENKFSPTLSRVPSYWVEDIRKISGVKIISAETVDIVYDDSNQKPVFLRGVTEFYKDIEKGFTLESGSWFNTSLLNQVVVGRQYADIYDLKVGDFIILNSRTRNIIQNIMITGIFSTNSDSEDGIIGSISLGKLMSNLPEEYINLIRVKFDSNDISKDVLNDIIFEKHKITIKIDEISNNTHDHRLAEVSVYSRTKEFINSSLSSFDGNVFFYLPFGTYFFQIVHPEIIFQSDFTKKFITGPETISIEIGRKEFQVKGQFTISEIPISKAEVTLNHLDSNATSTYLTDNNGNIDFQTYEGSVNVSINWKTYTDSQIIRIYNSHDLNIDYKFLRKINISDSFSSIPLVNGNLKIFDTNNNLLFNESVTGDLLYNISLLPDTIYKIVVNGFLNNTYYFREFNYTFSETSIVPVFIGPKNITLYVYDSEFGFYQNKSFRVWIKNNSTYSQSILITNSSGYSNYIFTSGDEVVIELQDSYRNKTIFERYIIENQETITINSGIQDLSGHLFSYNEDSIETNFSAYTVIIFKSENNILEQINPHNNGTFHLSIPYGFYTLKISSESKSFDFSYNFLNFTDKNLFIPVDKFSLELNFKNSSGFLINGFVTVNKELFGRWKRESVVSTSSLNTQLFFGKYQIIFENEENYRELIIDVKNNVSLDLVIPKKEPIINIEGNIINSNIKGEENLNISGNYIFGLVHYKWDNEAVWSNTTLPDVILIPPVDGFHNLIINFTNGENSYQKKFSYLINTLGINISLIDSINDAFVISGFIPKFSFTYPPLIVYYQWDNLLNSTSLSSIPNIEGIHELKINVLSTFNISKTFFFQFYLDKIFPYINDTTLLNETFNDSNKIVNFTFSENISRMVFRWNNDPYNTTNILIKTPTTDGYHNLTLEIRDTSGKIAEYSYFIKINHTSPLIILLNPSNESIVFIRGSILQFNISNYYGNITYKWNTSQEVISKFSKLNISIPLENGSYKLYIYARNIFGSITNKTYIFITNYSGLQLYTLIHRNNTYIKPNTILQFNASDHNGTIIYSWNNNGTSQIFSLNGFDITALPDEGNHFLSLYISNGILWLEKTYRLIIDNTPPSVNTTDGPFQNKFFIPNLEFSEFIKSAIYSWNNGTNNTILTSIPNGDFWHNLTIYLEDYAGNKAIHSLQFYSNNIPLNLRLRNTGNFSVISGTVPLEVLVDKPLDSLQCQWDNQSLADCSFLIQIPSSSGSHTLRIIAEDLYGMVKEIFLKLNLDLTPPLILNSNPKNNTIIGNQSFTFTFSEEISEIIYNWSGILNNFTNVPIIGDNVQGNQTLTIFIKDNANNWNKYLFKFFIDSKPPEVIIEDAKDSVYELYYAPVNRNLSLILVDISEPITIFYKWNTTPVDNSTEIRNLSEIKSPNEAGYYNIEIFILDQAQNWGNYSINYYVAQNWFELYFELNKSRDYLNNTFLTLIDENQNILVNQSIISNEFMFYSLDALNSTYISLNFGNYSYNTSISSIINSTYNLKIQTLNLELKDLFTNEYFTGLLNIKHEIFSSSSIELVAGIGENLLLFQGLNRLDVVLNNQENKLITRFIQLEESLSIVIPAGNIQGNIFIKTPVYPVSQAQIFLNHTLIGNTDFTGNLLYSVSPGIYEIEILLMGGTNYTFIDDYWEEIYKIYEISPKLNLNIIIQTKTGIGLQDVEVNLYLNSDHQLISTQRSNWQGSILFKQINFNQYIIEAIYLSETTYQIINVGFDGNISILIQLNSFEDNIIPININQGKWYNIDEQDSFSLHFSNELSEEIFNSLGFSIAFYAILLIIIGTTFLALIISIQHALNIILKRLNNLMLLGATPAQIIFPISTQISLLAFISSVIGNIIAIFVTIIFPQIRNISIGGLIINSSIDLLTIIVISSIFGIIILLSLIMTLRKLTHNNFLYEMKNRSENKY
ncbi:MAG: hypothetical protein HeimC3_23660 [Candidatus Heimdallarchaeota archaeon LC_3]|nr:MAG: hypothetical protein HeimC3_23660 [Candidatus Heimdallarchaeota archaeon LC_3]